jgi:hypothetical protein
LIRKGVGELKGSDRYLAGRDDITFICGAEGFHIRGERLQYRRDLAVLSMGMVAYFAQRNIGQIIFFNASRNVSVEDFVGDDTFAE